MWRLCPCGHDFEVRHPVPPAPVQPSNDDGIETVPRVKDRWILAACILLWGLMWVCNCFSFLRPVRDVLAAIFAILFWIDPFFWLKNRRKKAPPINYDPYTG